ncbi:hypothetical protein VitviT2T_014453 [Vitis vinifera]|uniref:Reverse transcriptase Ty1/copia-type domain-containing protein n=1 Tax=Vitis vinifera TaxID=29760 RepID=A0ABY9CM81_VITVI|nr:hypothetical protein VitviT2T_014453 [Vitis vinifera]
MQENETITKYYDRIALIVNKIRSLGEEFPNARIVEKVLVTLFERFGSKISSLEESRDLSQISLAELMNELQAQDQRRALRQENVTEEPKRSTLDSRAQKCILIGYGTSTKGYRIFCLQTNKVVLSKNVKVDEMTTWDWKNKKDAQSDVGFNNHEDFQTSKSVDDFLVRGTRSLEDIYQRCSLAINEQTSYVEVKDFEAWRRAMQEEMKMINNNETWQLVERPKNHKMIRVKWVFKTKLNLDGSICKYKARLVVRGYAQQYGVDY